MIRHCPDNTPSTQPPTKQAIERQRQRQVEALKKLSNRLQHKNTLEFRSLSRPIYGNFHTPDDTAA